MDNIYNLEKGDIVPDCTKNFCHVLTRTKKGTIREDTCKLCGIIIRQNGEQENVEENREEDSSDFRLVS